MSPGRRPEIGSAERIPRPRQTGGFDRAQPAVVGACNPEGVRRSALVPFSGLIAIALFVAGCGGSKSGAGNPLLDAPRSKTMIGGPGTLALPPRCDVAADGLGLEVCSPSELSVAYDRDKLSARGDLRAAIHTPLTEA